MKSVSKKWALMKQNVCHLLVRKRLKTADGKLRLKKKSVESKVRVLSQDLDAPRQAQVGGSEMGREQA